MNSALDLVKMKAFNRGTMSDYDAERFIQALIDTEEIWALPPGWGNYAKRLIRIGACKAREAGNNEH